MIEYNILFYIYQMSVNDFKNGEPPVQKAYTIGGIPIMFPYKAYPSQITMMDKIIKCLNRKYNCLLESPTGSGKSLALLCSTLAWMKKTGKEINEMEQLLNKHLNTHGVNVADTVPSYEENMGAISDFEKYKFKYSDNRCSKESECVPTYEENVKVVADFEKFKFSKKVNEVSKTKIKLLSEPSDNEKIESKFFSEDKCSDDICNSNVNCKNLSPLSNSPCLLSQSKFFSVNDSFKKRGITYIDEDFDDFQPVKKNKIFSVQQSPKLSNSSEEMCASNCDTYKQDRHLNSSTCKSADNNNYIPDEAAKKISDYENSNLPSKLPKIYFGTRTHKQIGQIIRELKKTPYKEVKMTILSSRERTCVHPINSKSRNKNEGCDELINRENGPVCDYYKNIRRVCYYHPPEMSTAFDLEDFVSICKRKRICPYFGAREMLSTSEIVFCPYNYLVDPLIRSALNITLKGNIVIMDEAHNIEDSAREAASKTISITEIQDAIADVLQIGQLKQDDSEPYVHIAKVLENLKKWLENLHDLKDYVSFNSSAKVWTGDDMIAVLNFVGLGPDTFPIFESNYKKIYKEENDTEKAKAEIFDDKKLSGSTHMCLKSLTLTLTYMFKDNLRFVPDYRCVVRKVKSESGDLNSAPSRQKRKSYSNVYEITINFWCLNPEVAFSDLKDSVHSLIVASGTLAPLASFQSELGMPFQITLEANHVVSREHMWVGTIGRGPSNNCLNGTFHHASTFAFQDDIGNLVLEVCSIIPHGVLCFLPSYGMLDKLTSRWQLTGLWEKLLSKKVVLCEPRRANEDFQQIMQEFYEAVKDSESNMYNEVRGALFLAVCRGKVSEGLDFADNNARAVITVGIPFPNIKDAQVDLKKKYNDFYSSKKPIVTGSEWYEMQAFRALNQALGRCIRHRNDFGALIIVDERFQKYNRYIGALSKWIRKDIEHFSSFYVAMESLEQFTERMGLKQKNENL